GISIRMAPSRQWQAPMSCSATVSRQILRPPCHRVATMNIIINTNGNIMKKIAAILFAVLVGNGAAFAHQMEGGSTEGIFGLKAEYVHVLLNPLPVYGLAIGALVLAVGLFAQSKTARNTGLLVVVFCAASAWPVLYFGQHGSNHLYPQLDTESQQWLDAHMDRAEQFIYAFYVTAILGIGALITQKKFPKASKVVTL